MKSKKFWPEISVVIVEVLLALLHLLSGIFPQLNENPGVTFGIITSAQITVLGLYFILRIYWLGGDIFAKLAPLDEFMRSTSEVKALYANDFYKNFLGFVEGARKIVSITHLDTRPPNIIKGSMEENYYNQFNSLVKSKAGIHFQRVERFSRDKIEWIENFIATHAGKGRKKSKNFSLSCLSVPDKGKLPHISLQLIDNECAFLVAISGHNTPYTERDLYIRDNKAINIWRQYYDNTLWKPAIPIIENGVLNVANWNKLKGESEG